MDQSEDASKWTKVKTQENRQKWRCKEMDKSEDTRKCTKVEAQENGQK